MNWWGQTVMGLLVIGPLWLFPIADISFFYKFTLTIVGLAAGWYFVEKGGATRGAFSK